jgi:hypothetical protein
MAAEHSIWGAYNVSKLSRAERSEGTGSACPDDNAVGTEVLSRWRRRIGRIVVRLQLRPHLGGH